MFFVYFPAIVLIRGFGPLVLTLGGYFVFLAVARAAVHGPWDPMVMWAHGAQRAAGPPMKSISPVGMSEP